MTRRTALCRSSHRAWTPRQLTIESHRAGLGLLRASLAGIAFLLIVLALTKTL